MTSRHWVITGAGVRIQGESRVLIKTTRFGPMEIDPQKTIHFPSGLLGFHATKDFIIFDHDHDHDVPFKWLQAIQDPDLAFLIMDPFSIMVDYQVDIHDLDLQELRANQTTAMAIFVILTIRSDGPMQMTANLKGPVLVNEENRWAKQLVLTNSAYPTRHPIFDALSMAENSTSESQP